MRSFREYKPSCSEALPLVRALYEWDGAGCCLHVVLDDHNVEDVFVESSIEKAITEGHWYCEVLARMLRSMSKTQRMKLGRSR